MNRLQSSVNFWGLIILSQLTAPSTISNIYLGLSAVALLSMFIKDPKDKV